MSTMDPFDEFEFKPLTDGLGFHKKTVSLKEGLKKSGVLEDELQSVPVTVPKSLLENTEMPALPKHTFEDVLSALEKTPLQRSAAGVDLQFTEPLPRQADKKLAMEIEPVPTQSPFPAPSAYKNSVIKKIPTLGQMADVGTRRGAADSPQRNLIPSAVSLGPMFLDAIIVAALSLIFLMTVLFITKVDLAAVVKNLSYDGMAQLSLLTLFVAVTQMYAVVSRCFFGRTLGEWTFDMQLGEDQEHDSQIYPLRVVWRSLLNTVTGLAVLPLLSMLLNSDIAGRLSGARLYRQRI